MSVAKSYQQYPIQGDPFTENNKEYVNVLTPHGLKKVRWYDTLNETYNKRAALGFYDKDYITLLIGDDEEINEWAHSSCPAKAWYNVWFGWYVPSILEAEELPNTITFVQLKWDEDLTIEKVKEAKKHVFSNSVV